MKIDKISCSQFAGLRDKELNFEEGLNVICGHNESGKSSMVNMISKVLFQNVKLSGRDKNDKSFKNDYFPVQKVGSNFSASFIDGEIEFHTDEGNYVLTKEWGEDPRVTLVNPYGEKTRDEKKIKEILKDIFVYGEGVYKDMLFSSQKNAASTLQTLLDAAENSDAKKEVAEAAAQAFSESDGISADTIGEAIQKKIADIQGKHWDLEKHKPVAKTTRWSKEIGEIHKAYYRLEDANNNLNIIEELEKRVEDACESYNKKHEEEKKAQSEYNTFLDFFTALAIRSEKKKRIFDLEKEKGKYEEALNKWPEAAKMLEKAKKLYNELNQRLVLDKYEKLNSIKDEQSKLNTEYLNAECPDQSVISQLKANQKEINKLEIKLCGMNLNANIKLLGGHELEIISLRTGEKVVVNENTPITEAVLIRIPDVMEIKLSPADVDTEEITKCIKDKKHFITQTLEKYKVSSIEELEELKQNILEVRKQHDDLEKEFKRVLNEEIYDSIKAAAEAVTGEIRNKQTIDADINTLCGKKTLESFIGSQESFVQGYTEEYGNIDELKLCLNEKTIDVEKTKEEIEASGDIPEAYKNISDPEKYKAKLKTILDQKSIQMQEKLASKNRAEAELDSYSDRLEFDPKEDIINAQRKFEEWDELLDHWLHIQKVFLEQKENVNDNPLEELANYFTKNLNIISDGNVKSEFLDDAKLCPGIYSDDRHLDYEKLSEGTKESVSLAFRLAVLDYLFPEGNGIAVFDDPFTNMDDGRMKRSAELIRESAQKHQIIFLTCREEYANLLGSKVINM